MTTLVGGDRIDVLTTVLRSDSARARAGFRVYAFDIDAAALARRIIAAEDIVARAAERTRPLSPRGPHVAVLERRLAFCAPQPVVKASHRAPNS